MKKVINPNETLSIKKNQEIIISLGKRKFKRINTKWDYIHDLKAYLVYLKAKENLRKKEELCKRLSEDEDFKKVGISSSSIKMKYENYRYIDIGEGLSSFSRQSKKIYDKYKEASIQDIEQAIQILEKNKTQRKV